MKTKIFFDLDGTLLDSRKRLYELFAFLVPASELSFDEYWTLKKDKKSHKEILKNHLNYTENEISNFEVAWMSLIEAPEWLALDVPFEDVTSLLEELKRDFDLFIVTARQHKERTVKQIMSFGWESLFVDILVTEQRLEKSVLISQKYISSSQDWMIGDTGKDIQTGRSLGMRTLAVSSGFLSKEHLLAYKPDELYAYVTHISFKEEECTTPLSGATR